MDKNKLMSESSIILKKNSDLVNSHKTNFLKEENGETRDNRESLYAEEVIAILIRNQEMDGFQVEKEIKNPTTDDFKFLINYFTEIVKSPIKDQKELIQTVQRAVVKVKSFGLSSDAVQYGTKRETPTQAWATVYGGETIPIMPKTDVLNSEKHHSVKMRGPVHVLDGTQKQVGALCLYTLDQTKEKYSKKLMVNLKKEINDLQQISAKLTKIPDEEKYKKFIKSYREKHPKAKAKEIRTAAKKAKLIVGGGSIRKGDITLSVNASKMLDNFEKTIKILNDKLEVIFSSIKTDDEFKRVFLRESLTGEFMFDRKPASANSIIVWERNFKDVEQISIDYAVEEVLSEFRVPKFETKSSGNWMTVVGKLQTDLSKFDKESNLRAQPVSRFPVESVSNESVGKKSKIEEMVTFLEYSKTLLNKHMTKLKESKQSLREGKLNEESFFDVIKSIFSKMVAAVKFIGEKVSIYFAEIKEALSSAPSKIFNFFDLKLEVEPDYKVKVKF